MKNYGFVRVGAAVPEIKVADIKYNINQILKLMKESIDKNVFITVFPELCITGYTCADLFRQTALLESVKAGLTEIVEFSSGYKNIFIIGSPILVDSRLYNCGVVIQNGSIIGIVPKTHIPNYSEFYEHRWFESGIALKRDTIDFINNEIPIGTDIIFECLEDNELCFGIELCEDLWVPTPPSSSLAEDGAKLIFNLSASNELIGKHEYREDIIKTQSGRCIAGYIYCSAGCMESTTDLVFGGHSIIAEYGNILSSSNRFMQESSLIYNDIDIERLINYRINLNTFKNKNAKKIARRIKFYSFDINLNSIKRKYEKHPFVPGNLEKRNLRCEEIFSIQTTGLYKRFKHTGLDKAVIGISGGLDSTLALLVTVKTFDKLGISRKNIEAVTMPGFGTTDTTYNNAIDLMKSMGVSIREIDIKEACLIHFKDIGHDKDIHDVTYENVQARERTQILMDIANKIGALVIGTGDLSELALGWCTYNGDHMSMYAVNCSIPKTLVKYLVEWVADFVADSKTKRILHSIIDTPISPELLPPTEDGEIEQMTEDIVGPYELHDFFMYHMIRYGASPSKILYLADNAFKDKYNKTTIKKWLEVFIKRFFSQQFKRSCIPDGPKVGTISLSPRGDWRMPSDAVSKTWLESLQI